MPDNQISVEDFGKRIKQKYPQYKHLSDSDIAYRVLDKYPQYKSSVKLPHGPDLLKNPVNPETGKGEGLYKLKTPKGETIDVPYSNVDVFTDYLRGYSFADPSVEAQYKRDKAAEGGTPKGALETLKVAGQGVLQGLKTMTKAVYVPMSGDKDGIRRAEEARESLIQPNIDELNKSSAMSHAYNAHQSYDGMSGNDLGMEALGHGGAGIIPMLGPFLAESAEQGARQWVSGDKSGAVTSWAIPVVAELAPKAVGKVKKLAPRAADAMSAVAEHDTIKRVAQEERQAEAHRQVISRIGGPISPAETTDVTRQLYRNQAAAMPEKVAAMKTGKPMEAVNAHRDIARATKRSIDDLHRGEVRKYRQSSFDGKAVADKLLASISDDEKSAMTAGDRERAISLLERIANQKNLGSANEMRITLGDETAGYDSHGNPQQVSPGFKKVLDRAYNISREEYYNRLKEVSGKDFSGLKKKEGYIIREIEAIDDARYKLEQKEELQKGKLGRERLGAAIKGVGGIVEGGFPSVPIVGPLAKFLGDKVSGSELERLQTQLNTMYSDLGEHVPIDVEGAYRGNETGPAVRPGPAPKGEQPKGPTAIELYQQAIELYQHGPAPRPGSVEVPTERGLPAPAGQKMLPGGGTKALSAPPAPWKGPPPFNPGTARESTRTAEAEAKMNAAMKGAAPTKGFKVGPNGEAVPVAAGELTGKTKKGPAPRKTAKAGPKKPAPAPTKPAPPVDTRTPAQQTDDWASNTKPPEPPPRPPAPPKRKPPPRPR